jgi:hypothetical protein
VIGLICYLVALVLFLLATCNIQARINLLALGLAFAVLPHLINAFLDAGV